MGERTSRGQRWHIDADEGYVKADLTDDDSYHISFYTVRSKYQERGFGKELMKLAKEHATSLGAVAITASNIANERSAHTMAAVFGYDSLVGSPRPDQVAELFDLYPRVTMDYAIKPDDPTLRNDIEILPGVRHVTPSSVLTYWNNRQVER